MFKKLYFTTTQHYQIQLLETFYIQKVLKTILNVVEKTRQFKIMTGRNKKKFEKYKYEKERKKRERERL